jgi:hypothetical protein
MKSTTELTETAPAALPARPRPLKRPPLAQGHANVAPAKAKAGKKIAPKRKPTERPKRRPRQSYREGTPQRHWVAAAFPVRVLVRNGRQEDGADCHVDQRRRRRAPLLREGLIWSTVPHIVPLGFRLAAFSFVRPPSPRSHGNSRTPKGSGVRCGFTSSQGRCLQADDRANALSVHWGRFNAWQSHA